jgi:hypothetical protein
MTAVSPVRTAVRQTRPASRTDLGRYSPDQDLSLFGRWCGNAVWVPPRDRSRELAQSMLNRFGPLASRDACWNAVVEEHRSEFTQVREMELPRPSIRLPRGRVLMAVTDRRDFDTIEDPVPDCVQTRLQEFLDGPGRRRGVRVWYVKPLCVEVGNRLIMTTRPELDSIIARIRNEVFSEYRRQYLLHRARRWSAQCVNAGLSVPRSLIRAHLDRKKREIVACHAHLEFERRKRALAAMQTHHQLRTDGCGFDDMLALMDAPRREDVIDHYVRENELSKLDRQVFLVASAMTAVSIPWFLALSMAVSQAVAISLTTSISVGVCDPAFVAELPEARGQLLKIGHFDEIDGVMHVEI